MKFEDVLGDMRTGSKATLTDLAGFFTYESGKIFQINEKVKKEFTQLENYLASDGWELVVEPSNSETVTLTQLKSAWDSVIVPDTTFANNQTSAKFLAFVKAIGF